MKQVRRNSINFRQQKFTNCRTLNPLISKIQFFIRTRKFQPRMKMYICFAAWEFFCIQGFRVGSSLVQLEMVISFEYFYYLFYFIKYICHTITLNTSFAESQQLISFLKDVQLFSSCLYRHLLKSSLLTVIRCEFAKFRNIFVTIYI